MDAGILKSHYQVVIIGGGMVGASFALALEKLMLASTAAAVLVVEAVAPSTEFDQQPSFDARSTALSYGSRKILERAGLWPELAEFAEPIKRIHVSDRGHFGSTSLDCAQMQVEALGYVLENRHLGNVYNAGLEQSARIELLRPAVISSLRPLADGMEVNLQRGEVQQTLHADLVVLADGGKSLLCRQLGIGIRTEDYQQQAVICNIALENHHDNTAYERFTDSGPMAVLPLRRHDGEHRAALVWTVSANDADELDALSESQILERLQSHFGYRLGRITHMGQRYVYPLSLIVAQEQIRPGLALLGNVAHTLHPVAGQGFNLALRDANALALNVAQAINTGSSPGSMAVLQRFINQQERDQHRTIDFSHYLTRIFSNKRPSLVWTRKLGLAAIDLIPALKKEFARQAMGLADR